MRVAKAKKEEFDLVYKFIILMENLLDSRSFFSQEESWRDWPDSDDNKKELLEIEDELKEYEGDEVDNDIILYHFIKNQWRKANYCGSFGRVVCNADVLIDNACDPDLDYLDFKPEIKNAGNMALDKVKEFVENTECKDSDFKEKLLSKLEELKDVD